MYTASIIHDNFVFDLGRALVFHHAFVCFGVFYAHSLSAIVTNAQLTGLCMVWPALHIFISVFMPESPLYAYKCYGDSEYVKTAMRRVRGPDYDVDSDLMALEVFARKRPGEKSLQTDCPAIREIVDCIELFFNLLSFFFFAAEIRVRVRLHDRRPQKPPAPQDRRNWLDTRGVAADVRRERDDLSRKIGYRRIWSDHRSGGLQRRTRVLQHANNRYDSIRCSGEPF